MSPALKPYLVEIARTETFIHYADVLVFAESASLARDLAQPLADRANDWKVPTLPFDYMVDDGHRSDWVVRNAEPATPEDVDLRSCDPNTINAPSDLLDDGVNVDKPPSRYALALIEIPGDAPEGYDPSTRDGLGEIALQLRLGTGLLGECVVYRSHADLLADIAEAKASHPALLSPKETSHDEA